MSAVPPPPPQSHKSPRVLACVLCQHRKIKCDRSTPCSNCVKVRRSLLPQSSSMPGLRALANLAHQAGVTCTPSTPAPARKRRRPNQDLQERLARCEELLKQYATGGSPPSTASNPPSVAATSATPAPKKEIDTPSSVTSSESQSTILPQPRYKIIQEDGVSRFMDSRIWGTIVEEVSPRSRPVDLLC